MLRNTLQQYIAIKKISGVLSANKIKLDIANKANVTRQSVDKWLKTNARIFIDTDGRGIVSISSEPDIKVYYQRRSTKE